MDELDSGIRRASSSPREGGHSAVSTAGLNGGDPLLSRPTPVEAAPQIVNPRNWGANQGQARRDTHNEYGWKQQHRLEVGAYAETAAYIWQGTADDVVIDPTAASVHVVILEKANSTCTISLHSSRVPGIESTDDPNRGAVHSEVIVIVHAATDSVAEIDGVKWAGGKAPKLKGSSGAADVVTVVVVPGVATFGFEGGSAFSGVSIPVMS